MAGMNESRAAVSTLGRSHLVFIYPGVKIIGAYYRDILLAQHLLPAISSNVCWMCGVRINETKFERPSVEAATNTQSRFKDFWGPIGTNPNLKRNPIFPSISQS